MASKDPGAKSEPWSSLHPDSVLAAFRLNLHELLRPTKWTAQANGVALMHRQTLICSAASVCCEIPTVKYTAFEHERYPLEEAPYFVPDYIQATIMHDIHEHVSGEHDKSPARRKGHLGS